MIITVDTAMAFFVEFGSEGQLDMQINRTRQLCAAFYYINGFAF